MAHFTQVPGTERLLAGRLCLYAFLTTSGYAMSRSLADGLFLGRVGPERLPLIMLVSAATVIPLSLWWTRRSHKWPLVHSIAVARLLLAGATMVLAVALPRYPESRVLLGLLYLGTEVRGVVNTTQFVTLLNESLTAPQRWLVPIASAGAPLAGIACGILVGVELGELSFSQLFGAMAALDLLSVVTVRGIHTDSSADGESADSEPDDASRDDSRAHRALVRGIALMVLVQVAVLSVVGYEWRIAAAYRFKHDDVHLARFFAEFYAAIDACTLLCQLLLARRQRQTTRTGRTLLVLPVVMTLCLTAALLATTNRILLIVLTLARASDFLRRGLHDPGLIQMYGPLPAAQRRRVISLVNGLVKPLAECVTVVTIFAVTLLSADDLRLAVVGVLVSGYWVLVVGRTLTAFRRCQAIERRFSHHPT